MPLKQERRRLQRTGPEEASPVGELQSGHPQTGLPREVTSASAEEQALGVCHKEDGQLDQCPRITGRVEAGHFLSL